MSEDNPKKFETVSTQVVVDLNAIRTASASRDRVFSHTLQRTQAILKYLSSLSPGMHNLTYCQLMTIASNGKSKRLTVVIIINSLSISSYQSTNVSQIHYLKSSLALSGTYLKSKQDDCKSRISCSTTLDVLKFRLEAAPQALPLPLNPSILQNNS